MNSSDLLGYTTFFYLAASFLYIAIFVFRAKKLGMAASGLILLGFLLNTAGIALRWVESYKLGVGHAPLSNMYESLVFFAWCIAIFYLYLEVKYKNRVIGAFAVPFAFLSMALASLTSPDIKPLIPALQSNWLIAHVMTCFVGYAAFAVAAGLGFMYLYKECDDGKNANQLFISLEGRSSRASYILNWVVLGCVAGLSSLFFTAITGGIGIFAKLFSASLFVFVVWAGIAIGVKRLHDQNKSGVWMFLNLIPIANLYLLYLLLFVRSTQGKNNYGDQPLPVKGEETNSFAGVLPSLRTTDDITHKTLVFGFLWLSAGIITGAVWANSAWGTYWSWDPKETWSLITWFLYAGALHARFTKGWGGKRIAWLAIIGFVSVIFTYYGVNYLLSGLHSYGG